MKFKLNPEALEVTSFATDQVSGVGTVWAHDSTNTNIAYTCGNCGTAFCGGYGNTDAGSCNCPTDNRCAYPSTSCGPTETYDQQSCHCLYPPTDWHLCGCGGTDDSGGAMC